MNEENKDLYYLEELPDFKVAKENPDVRGWNVLDKDERKVGTVDSLLVSKSAKRVVYLDVLVNESVIAAGHEVYGAQVAGVHEFLNKAGEDHLILPIGMVTIDEAYKIIRSKKITHDTFASTKRFSKGIAINRDYELSVHGTFVPGFPEKTIPEAKNFYDREEFLAY
ncbi:YlmC/YmxH family sporulation protein [Pedobacter endophyticus]|uniref:PRC-barrel domain-containing protein n=1 Tax=Pedobacter endophyticus TaxID=2789740 RepID=A0A7U3Q4U7_9SPHI|nr:PRC-barrel domain-containing protein [Pedobacter endophyticus]QPH38604.1 PRC-barrel domain-containing protein [Pedobacter endophyticus]